MTTTAPAFIPATGAAPMAAELADAYLDRLHHLLANLEAEATALADASWGSAKDTETARYLADSTRKELTDWVQRISGKLEGVCRRSDVNVAAYQR